MFTENILSCIHPKTKTISGTRIPLKLNAKDLLLFIFFFFFNIIFYPTRLIDDCIWTIDTILFSATIFISKLNLRKCTRIYIQYLNIISFNIFIFSTYYCLLDKEKLHLHNKSLRGKTLLCIFIWIKWKKSI